MYEFNDNYINLNDYSETINLYKILEVKENSSQKEIRTAWKKLALKYHPDKNNKNNKNNDEFIKIKYAYDILSNEELRIKYDNDNNKIKTLNNLTIKKINIINFLNTTEIEKIIKLLFKKQKDMIIFNNINNIYKQLIDIVITIDFELKDIWNCEPKIIKYLRETKNEFEEIIYPTDFIQIYENEGEEIIINKIKYIGNLTVKINTINMFYNGENYYILDNKLYILINKNRIINDRINILFLDDMKYKFNIKKMIKLDLENIYIKKNFGLPKINDIIRNDLFFIII